MLQFLHAISVSNFKYNHEYTWRVFNLAFQAQEGVIGKMLSCLGVVAIVIL